MGKLVDRAGQLMVAKQVGIDMFVVHPFMFFPLFYQLKAFVEGTCPKEALQRCWRNWGSDLRVLWFLWIPAQTFNFACAQCGPEFLLLLLLLLERLQGQCRTGSWRMSMSVRQQWHTCTLQELSRCVWFAAQCNTNRSPIFYDRTR